MTIDNVKYEDSGCKVFVVLSVSKGATEPVNTLQIYENFAHAELARLALEREGCEAGVYERNILQSLVRAK